MDNTAAKPPVDGERQSRHSAFEVLRVFLRLGLTSFGGPIAHGYFRREFVDRCAWVDEDTFVDLVTLCQFLPGPGSSQLCFVLGLSRSGWLGALAAWVGFTLPSAILLFLFARFATGAKGATAIAATHGLKIVAVAVVAQAVWGMAKSLTPDARRVGIALVAGAIVLFISRSFAQMIAIALGGLTGLAIGRHLPITKAGFLKIMISPFTGVSCLVAFVLFLLAVPLLEALLGNHTLAIFNAFYRTGALVFGGGHVVLPLLRDAVEKPGWISENSFLTGYGAAQAVPGPLFTVAAYLGAALNRPPNGIGGAVIALVAIFLPGILLVTGALPFWDGFRTKVSAQATIRGVNAAVVGILTAALYDPLWKSAIHDGRDAALALVGFLLLVFAKIPSWLIVVGITTIALSSWYFSR